ncbi:MAG: hypothetical protein ACLPUG_18360 [Acidimicrobiales bacterium]|jgi:hypothetical protein
MWPRLTDEALELGDEVTTFADLLLLGIATGLLEEAIGFTRRGLWALEQVDADLSRERLREEAVAFRRARRLESGQDLRAWLEARVLTMDDWEAHLLRSLAVRKLAASAIPEGAPEIGLDCRAFAVDLVCGGWWRRFADLARRLWAASRLVENDLDLDEDHTGDEPGHIMAMLEPLATLGEPWCAEALRRVRSRERALEETTRRCATAEAVAARILEHAAEWTELRFDEILLPSREAANEALLCARDDGVDAADLATRAQLPLRQRCARHDALPLEAASLLEGALLDQPFGPVALDERWAVLWLRERRRPSIQDDATRAAASAELLEETLLRATKGLVREVGLL